MAGTRFPPESYFEWWNRFTSNIAVDYFPLEEDLRGLLEIDGVIHCDPFYDPGSALPQEVEFCAWPKPDPRAYNELPGQGYADIYFGTKAIEFKPKLKNGGK